ncbi:MAG: hypothetical protein ACU4EQ_12155 [Candidatus Nitrosoglobus sp.]|jgi:hypothetical protein
MDKHFSTVVSLLIASMAAVFPLSAAKANPLSNSLNAFFTSVDNSGCVTTEVSITAHSGGLSVKSAGKSPDEKPIKNIDKITGGGVLFVNILRINECQGKVILHAKGRKGLGSERLQIALAQGTGTATLKLPIKIINPGSGKPFDADVSLTWVGNGEPVTVIRSRYFDEPGQIVTAARPFKQTFQSAQASGSVSINGENFTPESSQDASILLYGS